MSRAHNYRIAADDHLAEMQAYSHREYARFGILKEQILQLEGVLQTEISNLRLQMSWTATHLGDVVGYSAYTRFAGYAGASLDNAHLTAASDYGRCMAAVFLRERSGHLALPWKAYSTPDTQFLVRARHFLGDEASEIGSFIKEQFSGSQLFPSELVQEVAEFG